MSQVAIIGLVALMVCCSSSSSVMLMMGGDDTPSSPAPSTSPAPSQPTLEYIVVDESHVTPLRAGAVELGAGDSVEKCRKLAYDKNYAAFGFRKGPKTCWAIVDGEDTKNKVQPLVGHAVGCVTKGESIKEGCMTTKDKVVRARHLPGFTSYQNIACNSINSCRAAAKAQGANHFGWREAGGNGWVITSPGVDTLTPGFLLAHTMGCTDPTKKFPKKC